ncbi:MAG: peptidylprolyl isomerase [Bacteroidales bacterium]|nr:peptidylprolyl isomerase [Bacteroidales bacterium]
MQIRKAITYTIALVFTLNLNAQKPDILLQVNDRAVSMDEFKWLYLKNNTAEHYSGIEEYLDLYINLRLKVEAAEEAGIHKRPSFKTELEGYRKQLAKNFLTDNEFKDRLIEKAYERYKTEIHALHILIKCPADVLPADTLQAYARALNIRQRLRLGEPFESVAKGASDDPGVNINGGNLGYFTVFQTPLPFENAVYSMKPGELSMPVRTASGYHIIKVQDKRKNQGRIKVAHIMKSTPPGSTETARIKAKYEIDSIYRLLENGADFSELARTNSDDMMSAANGGELPWFGTGEMIHEFSVEAFRLLRDNDYTKPVKTVYGWHIIKRLDKEEMLTGTEARKYLENRLSNSYLISESKKSFAEKLKKEYSYKLNRNALEWFHAIADSSFRYGSEHKTAGQIPGEILYSFASEQCNMQEFASYISQNGNRAPDYNNEVFINTLLDQKVYEHLLDYENSILEQKYPEFRFLMNEFYDGILLFEISDSLIWKRSENDSTGLKEYYNTRKDEFMAEPGVRARIYEIDKNAGKRKTRRIIRIIRRHHNRDNYYQKVMAEAVTGKDTLVNITEGMFEKGENVILDNTRWHRGLNQQQNNNGTILVDILEVERERYKDIEDVMGLIINDYQEYLEQQWLRELNKRYEVSINRSIMEKLKSETGK